MMLVNDECPSIGMTASEEVDPNELHMLDVEKGKILVSLGQSSKSGDSKLVSGQTSTSRSHLFKLAFTLAVLLFGAFAGASILMVGINAVNKQSREDFFHEASQFVIGIEHSWAGYETFALWIHESCHFNPYDVEEHIIEGLTNASIIASQEQEVHTISMKQGFCSRNKFQHLFQHINSTGKKMIAIQYISKITDELRDKLENESRDFMRARNPDFKYMGIRDYITYPNATVKELVPSPRRPFYFPIHYMEPLEKNEAAVDLDLYYYRKNEIDTALKTSQPVIGPRVRLFQDNRPGVYGVELLHPGFLTTLPGDLAASPAIAKLVIRVPDLIEEAARATLSQKSKVFIYDETPKRTKTNNGQPIFLAASQIFDREQEKHQNQKTQVMVDVSINAIPSASHCYSTTIQAADHTWRIIVQEAQPKKDIAFVVLGGVVIIVGCFVLAFAFRANLARAAKISEIRSRGEEEKAELALLQAKREMHLNDFIAHEVRNPLSSAIAAVSFVKSTAKEQVNEAETRQALLNDVEIIDLSLQYINTLLLDMLDIHRTASKKMKLEEAPTDVLKDIFEPVKAILCVKQDKAKILIECPEQLVVVVDRLRVKQIILNLAINSTKFVTKGFIRLRAEVTEFDSSVRLFVEDSGPGIRPEQQEHLFDKFQESFDLLAQGTGLGLHVCKNLSELMVADLHYDATYNSGLSSECPGTRFVLDLHRPPDRSQYGDSRRGSMNTSVVSICTGVDNDESLSKDWAVPNFFENLAVDTSDQPLLPAYASVLFVDDDFILRKLFKRTLKKAAPNWRIDEASNGETALTMTETNMYDLIFLDQYMASVEKQMLGSETVRALRQKGVTSTVCGLSANDMKDEFLECGADAFMLKPFPCQAERLQAELKKLLEAGSYNRNKGAIQAVTA